MKKIKHRDTAPELALARELRSKKVRYSRSNQKVIGSPDFVIKGSRKVIFIDGEFWHGFRWSRKKLKIKVNRAYWIPKIEKNIKRDRAYNRALRKAGWIVLRFWEHEIKKDLCGCIKKIMR